MTDTDKPRCGAPLRHVAHQYAGAIGLATCDGSPTDPPLSLAHYDHRSQTIAQIRALADWMERNPHLPGVSDVTVHAHLDRDHPDVHDRFTGLVRQYSSDDEIGEGPTSRWCYLREDDQRERGGVRARFLLHAPLAPVRDPYDDDMSAVESSACDL